MKHRKVKANKYVYGNKMTFERTLGGIFTSLINSSNSSNKRS